jgi:hypothetical protein
MQRFRTLFALAALAGSLTCIAGTAVAQARDRAGAEALFRAGRQAMDSGNYAEACRRFEESNRMDPAVGTVFNLGACKEKQGKLAEAWGHFREVIERLPAGDERVVIASARAQAIEPRLAHLTLTVKGELPAEARVVRDGTALGAGSLGVPLPVDAGKHTVVLEIPGHERRVVEVSLAEGQSRTLDLEPGAQGEADASTAPERTDPNAPDHDATGGTSGRKTWAVVLIGAGAAGLLASLATGAVVLSSKGTVSDHCANKQCDQEGLDAAATGRTFSTISTACFAVGTVALGGGVVLLATSGGSPSSDSKPAGWLMTVRGQF